MSDRARDGCKCVRDSRVAGSLGTVIASALLLASGELSAATTQVAADASALAGEREAGRVPVAMSTTLARGRIEVRTFAIEGIPLRGAFEVLHIDAQGHTRPLVVRRPMRPVESASRTMAAGLGVLPIDAAMAAQRALALAPDPTRDADTEGPPILVYRLILGTPVLAWEVQLEFSSTPEPTRKTLWLSASTGVLLDERENVFSSRARVFAENPSSTPEPIEIELTDIDARGPGVPLIGPRVQSFNCVTTPPFEIQPWHDEGDCWAVARTFSGAAGDYFVPLPDPIDPASGTFGDDLYAELSMYVHGERFLNVLAERGITQYRCDLSTMLANFRTLPEAGDEAIVALNNAYYTDQCDPEKGPTMLFGQGTDVDFAFDSDVIYHELGHGVVALLTPDGLGGARPRPDGLVVDATAINEAMADYVSVMFQNDPYLAEYVGRFWSSQSTPYIRSATNTKRCPDDTVGLAHHDGEPLMAALWATRVEVGVGLDAIVLASLARLASDATLEEAAAAILAVASESRDAGDLTDLQYALLERELVVRGLTDCPRVITDPAAVAEGRTMFLRKVSASVQPFWPGPMQLRYEVPDDAHELVVAVDLSTRGSGEPTAAVLVKRGASPIAFTYDLVARDDAGDPTGAATKVRELTLVGGDWDQRFEATRIAGDAHEVEVGGLQPGEVVYLAVVATANVDVTASNVRVVDGRDHDALGSSSDDGQGDGQVREDVHGSEASASCACTSAGPGAPWAVVVVPGLRLVALGRRRRRGCG